MTRITFDPSKRDRTLEERGLDFVDAARVFAGDHLTFVDDRLDYGEPRFISVGRLAGRWWFWSGRRVARLGT